MDQGEPPFTPEEWAGAIHALRATRAAAAVHEAAAVATAATAATAAIPIFTAAAANASSKPGAASCPLASPPSFSAPAPAPAPRGNHCMNLYNPTGSSSMTTNNFRVYVPERIEPPATGRELFLTPAQKQEADVLFGLNLHPHARASKRVERMRAEETPAAVQAHSARADVQTKDLAQHSVRDWKTYKEENKAACPFNFDGYSISAPCNIVSSAHTSRRASDATSSPAHGSLFLSLFLALLPFPVLSLSATSSLGDLRSTNAPRSASNSYSCCTNT